MSTPEPRAPAAEPAAALGEETIVLPATVDGPRAAGGRFAQLTYTAFHHLDGSGGGWQVKSVRGEISPAEQSRVVDRIATKLDAGPNAQRFLKRDEIAALPRRLVYAGLGSHGEGGRRAERAWWHTAPAGVNSSGRPNNVFAHVVLDHAPATDQTGMRPSDLLRAPQWLRPWGADEVLATTLDAVPELPWTDPAASRSLAAEFIEYAAVQRPGTLAHLLDGVLAAMQGEYMVVLGVEQPERADFWIAAVSHLMSPATSRELHWSTTERAASVGTARAAGLHLVVVPLAELAEIELGEDVVLVSDAEEPGEIGDLAAGGDDHRTRQGSRIVVTPWSAIAAAVGSVGLAGKVLVLADQVAEEVGDTQLECGWPLAMAVAQLPAELGDVAGEAAMVVGGRPPAGLVRGSPLDALRRRLLSGELGSTTQEAWTALTALSTREVRSAPGWVFAANVYLERALADRAWLTGPQPAPVPDVPQAMLDPELVGQAQHLLTTLATRRSLGVQAGGPAAPAQDGRGVAALDAVRALDFVFRSRILDPARTNPDERPMAQLVDQVGRLLVDSALGPQMAERIGPLEPTLRTNFLWRWFDRYLDTAQGRPGSRVAPSVLSWLFPEPPALNVASSTVVEAAAQATAVFGDPSALRFVALDAALRRQGHDQAAVRRLAVAPPLSLAELRYLLGRHHPAALAAGMAPVLLSGPLGADLRGVLDQVQREQARAQLRVDDPEQRLALLAADLRWAQSGWWSTAPGEPSGVTRLLNAAEALLGDGGEALAWSPDLTGATAAAYLVERAVAASRPPQRPCVAHRLAEVFGADPAAAAVGVGDYLDQAVRAQVVTDLDLVVAAQVSALADADAIGRPWLTDVSELRLHGRPGAPPLLDWIIGFRRFEGRFTPNADFVEGARERLKELGAAGGGRADQVRAWWKRVGVTDEAVLAPLSPRRFWPS